MPDRMVIRDGAVDTAVVREYELARRDALQRGIALGGAAIAATSIPALLTVRDAFARAEGDAEIISGAVSLEQVAVLAYQTAIDAAEVVSKPIRRIAIRFRDQEQEHADRLSAALTELGGEAPEPPKTLGDSELLGPLKDAKTERDVLNFAAELETMAVAAYYDAHRKLRAPNLLRTTVQIMANEGQHLVVLRKALGKPPVPNAFETGKASP